MSVIITGMDIPESCRVCIRRRKCPQWNRRSLWKEEYIVKRSDSCPLKSIDGLIKLIKEPNYTHHDGKNHWYMTPPEVIDIICGIIKEYCEEE